MVLKKKVKPSCFLNYQISRIKCCNVIILGVSNLNSNVIVTINVERIQKKRKKSTQPQTIVAKPIDLNNSVSNVTTTTAAADTTNTASTDMLKVEEIRERELQPTSRDVDTDTGQQGLGNQTEIANDRNSRQLELERTIENMVCGNFTNGVFNVTETNVSNTFLVSEAAIAANVESKDSIVVVQLELLPSYLAEVVRSRSAVVDDDLAIFTAGLALLSMPLQPTFNSISKAQLQLQLQLEQQQEQRA